VLPARPVQPRATTVLPRALLAMATVLAVATAVLLPGRSAGAVTAPPLLFGENLDLYAGTASTDWFLAHPALRTGLVNAGVQVIRMPVRGSSPSTAGIANKTELFDALALVKSLGLTPLVILRNPQDPTLLTDDAAVVDEVNTVFGTGPVYYEFANETDLPGPSHVSAATYVSAWNATVPQLKAKANAVAQFIGPVNFQYDAGYLQTFLASANPLPDAISWHTYTCDDSTATEATCLANIDNWTTDFTAARTLMTSTIGKQLPIWDTEWNYTPTIDTAKANYTDTAFLKQWTTKALQTLAADGIAGSMHFNVQDLLPLANGDGSPAAEGLSFNAEYAALVGSGSTPSASSSPTDTSSAGASASPSGASSASPSASSSGGSSASASASATSTAAAPQYSFEDGTVDGWDSTGDVTSLVNSTDVAGQVGTHELEIAFHSTGSSDWPYIHVNPAAGPTAGQTLTAYVYVPSTTTTAITAQLYVQDSAYAWHTAPGTVISQRGSWVKLSFAPSGYTGSAIQVGLQMQESSPFGTASTIYVDSVGWS
jgi:hypothetical protein